MALLLASGGESCKPRELRKVLVQGLTPQVDSWPKSNGVVCLLGRRLSMHAQSCRQPAHLPSGLRNKSNQHISAYSTKELFSLVQSKL